MQMLERRAGFEPQLNSHNELLVVPVHDNPIVMLSEVPVKIQTSRFILQTLTPVVVSQEYLSWFSEAAVKQFIVSARNPQTLESIRDFVSVKWRASDCLFLGIYTKAGEHIGNVKFDPISTEKRCAVMGILIGSVDYRGQGVGPEVIRGGAEYLKANFGIDTLELGVEAENKSAIRSYEKMGFAVVNRGKLIASHGQSLVMQLLI